MIAEYEREAERVQWDGIYDAFEPVRRLVQGENSLVAESIYEQYRHVTSRVLSRVSLVRSESPWAFICISAGAFGAPRWLDLIRPVWYEKLQQPRYKPLLLKDIRKELISKGIDFGDQVIQEFRSFPVLPSAEERVSACIIGVA